MSYDVHPEFAWVILIKSLAVLTYSHAAFIVFGDQACILVRGVAMFVPVAHLVFRELIIGKDREMDSKHRGIITGREWPNMEMHRSLLRIGRNELRPYIYPITIVLYDKLAFFVAQLPIGVHSTILAEIRPCPSAGRIGSCRRIRGG